MSKRFRRLDDDDLLVPQSTFHDQPTDGMLDDARRDDVSGDDGDDGDDDDQPDGGPVQSTYPDADHGPQPVPQWVITHADALDDDLGVLKSGKEADVSLLRRSHGAATSLMAVKRYRSAEHRLFHRDAGYLEGRRVRRSRENRAMERRTEFGRELIAGQWARAEFSFLTLLWSRGAPVPYPVQLCGTELMMEFIGSADGVAAPRLAALRPSRAEAEELFVQMCDALGVMAEAGYVHGDLSPYNVLVDQDSGRLLLIDLPQAVDLVGNPQGFAFLRRDCDNICSWFTARGVDASPAALEADLLRRAGA
ncbi:MAG TPA: RIO1 family regulatory kinase/ATPase [Ilumatobacteraceae bacterium]|nr:RIO1 family regulatory kinase/ATPase [Ilumatobacteraceae bacterium]